jgi:SMC interacting uncharacterized protein involved in chromosome segregation
MSADREQLVAELREAHQAMLERDSFFARCEHEVRQRDEQLAALRSQLDAASAHIEHLTRAMTQEIAERTREIAERTREIEAMKGTRAWRLAERYWALRDRARRRA